MQPTQQQPRQGHFHHVQITRQQVQQATQVWVWTHGPVPKVPYDPRQEWRASCDFHNFSACESPVATEMGVSGAPL